MMLPFVSTFVLGAAIAAAPAQGTYTYAASLAGAAMEKTTITVAQDASGVRLSESAAGRISGDEQSGQTVLTLDQSLAPVSYTATYNAMGKTLHSALAFSGQTASQTGDLNARPATFTLPAGANHFVVLDGTMFSGFFALPSQLHAWGSAAVVALAPMFGRSYPIAVDPSVKPERPATVPATDVALSASSPIGFTLWYDPATFIVDELDVPTQEATVIRQR